MPEPKPLDPQPNRLSIALIGLGAVVFVVGLYVGFVKHAGAALVFSMLGVAMALFATVGVMLFKPVGFGVKTVAAGEPPPAAAVRPPVEGAVMPHGVETPKPQAGHATQPPPVIAMAMPAPAPKGEPPVIATAMPAPEPKGEPAAHSPVRRASDSTGEPNPDGSIKISQLMEMKLGDLLLAALRNDPEGAGRIFARALTQQAEASAPAAAAGKSKDAAL